MTLSALHKPKSQQDITDQKARHRRHSFPYHSDHALSSYEVKDESYKHLSDLPFRGRCRGSAHCRVTRHHLALQLETNNRSERITGYAAIVAVRVRVVVAAIASTFSPVAGWLALP